MQVKDTNRKLRILPINQGRHSFCSEIKHLIRGPEGNNLERFRVRVRARVRARVWFKMRVLIRMRIKVRVRTRVVARIRLRLRAVVGRELVSVLG